MREFTNMNDGRGGQLLSVCFVAIAFAFSVFYFGGTSTILLLVPSFLLVVGMCWRLWSALGAGKIHWSSIHAFLLLYVAMLILNIYTSVYTENTVLMAWVFLALPLVVFVLGEITELNWKFLVKLIALLSVVSACWGIVEFFITKERANGPVLDPNYWASMLNITYFLILSQGLSHKHRTNPIVLVVLTIISLAIFSSYSRVGMLIFFAALTVSLIAALNYRQLRLRVILICLSVVFSFGVVNLYVSAEKASHNYEGYTLNMGDKGWAQRISQWRAGLSQYSDYPVFGSGLGTFKLLYPQYRNKGDLYTAGNYVHNDYVQLLAEAGPLVVLFVVLFVCFLIYHLFISILEFVRTKRQLHLETLVLVVAMGTVFVHALMNFTLYNFSNQILVACCLMRILSLNGRLYLATFTVRQPVLAKCLVVGIAGYVIIINTLDFISFDLVYNGGVIPMGEARYGGDLALYSTVSTIAKIRPGISGNRFAMATFYRTSFDAQAASALKSRTSLAIVTALEYQAGLEINPYNYQIRRFFSEFLQANPDLSTVPEIYQTPERLLRQGLAFGPCYIDRYLELAIFLEKNKKQHEAYALLTNGAMRWVNLHYDGYQEHRIKLYKKLLQMARQRGDEKIMLQVLTLLNPKNA